MSANILFVIRRRWTEWDRRERRENGNHVKGSKAEDGEWEENDPKAKILGGIEQEESGKTAVQHRTPKISKNVGSSLKSQGFQLLPFCSLLGYTHIKFSMWTSPA